ncbi:MAG: nucleotidyltransferase family protein [Deltaproteobacteria bacterium]|nr:nucleotidyltransferase family protein [Deltaproteobacteria bacterium]
MKHFPKKAMILAAGLGERLRPLTLKTPKPLIPVAGHPLMLYNLMLLQQAGVEEVMINLFHLGDQIRNFFQDGKQWGLRIHYSEEETILGTGGGLKKVESFFDAGTFCVMNGDVLVDLSLPALWQRHQETQALATLAISPTLREDVQNYVFANSRNQILEIGPQCSQADQKGIFTGVHLLEPEVLKKLPKNFKSCIIQDAYRPLIHEGKTLSAFSFSGYFRDVGTFERYDQVQKELSKDWPFQHLKPEEF